MAQKAKEVVKKPAEIEKNPAEAKPELPHYQDLFHMTFRTEKEGEILGVRESPNGFMEFYTKRES